ncbi:hypothetical protein [Cohnella mopanensis]|uniref:hypothetical protein n=1 Tax=Cohnella mopanensis TaxID=2911966 RepID=UPI001EF84763|nr:hypothetical protein [Cohnella mopanensis]
MSTNLNTLLNAKLIKPMILMIFVLCLIGCNDSESQSQSKEDFSVRTIETINTNETSGTTDDEEELSNKAMEIVARSIKATYNKETDDYSIEGESYNVILIPFGFVESGEYEVRVCPSYYPLSVFNYYLVDLKEGTIREE